MQLLLTILGLPYIILSLILLPFNSIQYSNGERVGNLIKFSQKGVIYKNWCGQINMGGMIAQDTKYGTNYVPYVFEFGVDNKDTHLVDKINNLVGQRVKVTYNQRVLGDAITGCNDYFITNITLSK